MLGHKFLYFYNFHHMKNRSFVKLLFFRTYFHTAMIFISHSQLASHRVTASIYTESSIFQTIAKQWEGSVLSKTLFAVTEKHYQTFTEKFTHQPQLITY